MFITRNTKMESLFYKNKKIQTYIIQVYKVSQYSIVNPLFLHKHLD